MGTSFFLMNTSRLTSLKGVKCYMRIIYPTYHYPALEPKTVETGSLNFIIFFFFSIRVFFHRHWQFTGQQGKGGDHLLFHSTTSTRSRTFRHLFATLHVRWLSHIFNRTACIYQAATRWDLPPYQITIWLTDDVTLSFCLFTWWFDSSFSLLQQFEMGNRWIWTRIDYHPCITSEQTDQVWVSQVAVTIMQTR